MNRKLFSLERRIEKLGSEYKLNTKHTLIMKIPNFRWLHDTETTIINTQPKIQQHNNNGAQAERNDIDTGIADDEETQFQDFQAVDSEFTYSSKMDFEPCRLVNKNIWLLLRNTKDFAKVINIDTLILTFEFLVGQETENTVPKVLKIEDKKFDVPTVPEINVVLLMNEAYSDVTVRSAEGEEFPAHKNFLGTSSPVLKAHFAHDMLENKNNIVESPLEAVVLKELLTYIYTNAAPNIDQFPRKLLEAADYYQINGLKTLCEPALAKKLSVENAIQTLEFANMYRSDYLKRKTLEFIKNGAAANITETYGWKASTSIDVIKSVYECITRNKIE